MNINIHVHKHKVKQGFDDLILQQVFSLLKNIKMDLKTEFEALTTQVLKSRTEIIGKIGTLEEALANAGNVPEDVLAAFNDLKASVQSVDDIVPDEVPTPEEPPVIEPEPENPGTEQPSVEEPATEDPGVQPGEIPG